MLYIHLKTIPVITSWNFCKNTLDLMKSIENLNFPYYQVLKFPQKQVTFAEMIWWTASTITSWNFCKNKAVLIMSLQYVTCPYYHELTFLLKKTVLMMSLELFNWYYYYELKALKKWGSFDDVIQKSRITCTRGKLSRFLKMKWGVSRLFSYNN